MTDIVALAKSEAAEHGLDLPIRIGGMGQTPEPEEPRQVMEAEADYSTGYDDVQSLG